MQPKLAGFVDQSVHFLWAVEQIEQELLGAPQVSQDIQISSQVGEADGKLISPAHNRRLVTVFTRCHQGLSASMLTCNMEITLLSPG